MLGNVNEMLLDCLHFTYKGAPTDGSPRTEPGRGWFMFLNRLGGTEENGDCSTQAARGFGWHSSPSDFYVPSMLYTRSRVRAKEYGPIWGFRVVRESLPPSVGLPTSASRLPLTGGHS